MTQYADEELLTVREFAAYVKCAPETPYIWRRKGTGPRIARAGRGLRYRKADIDEWLLRRSHKDNSGGPSTGMITEDSNGLIRVTLLM